jgi:hypothetical protein
MKKLICLCAFALGLAMGLSACTDPYDPGQRAIGGGLFGAGTGAAIGGIAGGGRGAVTGALIGGALGAVGGAATTPSSGYYGPVRRIRLQRSWLQPVRLLRNPLLRIWL